MLYLHYYTDDIKNSQPSELFDASSGIKFPGKRERINDAKAGKKEKVADGGKKEKGIIKGFLGSLKTWMSDDHDDFVKSN